MTRSLALRVSLACLALMTAFPALADIAPEPPITPDDPPTMLTTGLIVLVVLLMAIFVVRRLRR